MAKIEPQTHTPMKSGGIAVHLHLNIPLINL
jgi:hypothetical protein